MAGSQAKTIWVFGATSAIAVAAMRLWAKEGARLALFARDAKKVEQIARDLAVRGAAKVVTFVGDLTDPHVQQQLLSSAYEKLGGVDWALVAYGNLPDQNKARQDYSMVAESFRVNLVSQVLLCEQVSDIFSRQGHGVLAAISSPAGERGRQSNYLYGSAKGGLTVFLQGLRNRLAPAGIRVITVIPGMVDTPMTQDFKKGLLFVKPEAIAIGLASCFRHRKSVVYLPGIWRWIMFVIRAIPEPIFQHLKL